VSIRLTITALVSVPSSLFSFFFFFIVTEVRFLAAMWEDQIQERGVRWQHLPHACSLKIFACTKMSHHKNVRPHSSAAKERMRAES
jgi:hypothetical protein